MKIEENKKNNRNSLGGIILFILIFLIIFISFKSCLSDNDKTSNKESNIKATLITEANKIVEEHLKAPSTADFPLSSEYTIKKEEGSTHKGFTRYSISGYVDSENSFGAKIRSNFTVVLDYKDKDNTYYTISCDIK